MMASNEKIMSLCAELKKATTEAQSQKIKAAIREEGEKLYDATSTTPLGEDSAPSTHSL